jgi:hypothetical protein
MSKKKGQKYLGGETLEPWNASVSESGKQKIRQIERVALPFLNIYIV